MIVKPFVAAHLKSFCLQPEHAEYMPLLADLGYGEELQKGEAYTCFVDDRIVACGGIGQIEPGRSIMWALLPAGAPMTAITRAVLRRLKSEPEMRFEAYVDHDFAAGHRWIQMLGFTDETPHGMRKFRHGKTFHLYSRVQ